MVGRVFNLLADRAGPRGITDTQCGFKLFCADVTRAIFSRQIIDRYPFDVEILLLAKQLGYRIAEVPIDWTHMPGSRVNVADDSVSMLKDLIRIRLTHRRTLGAIADLKIKQPAQHVNAE